VINLLKQVRGYSRKNQEKVAAIAVAGGSVQDVFIFEPQRGHHHIKHVLGSHAVAHNREPHIIFCSKGSVMNQNACR
jgi:hypothetical protein